MTQMKRPLQWNSVTIPIDPIQFPFNFYFLLTQECELLHLPHSKLRIPTPYQPPITSKAKLYQFDKDGNQWKERGAGSV
ncbi:hypothetical protein M8C21_011716, partial [Ambrosia artemisiifolia]